MTTQSTLEQVSAARPSAARHPELYVGTQEREQILASILSSTLMDQVRSRPVHRARTLRRGVAVVGLAAAALIVGLLGSGTVAHREDHGARQHAGGALAPSASTKSVVDVAAHLTTALTNVDDIELTQSRFNLGAVGVDTENRWTSPDGNTVRVQTSLNGEEQYDETMVTTGHLTTATVVDFPDRTWWTWSESADTPTCSSSATCRAAVATNSLSPSSIQRDVQAGTLHLVARNQMIAGHDAIELSGSASPAAPELGSFDLWIDAATYLPVRTANTRMGGSTSTSEFQWLPVTSTNLALLQVVVPSDFIRSAVPISPSSGPTGGLG